MTSPALTKALELAPIIERVHGAHHPELTRVRELTESLAQDGADTDAVFRELREVTADFAIPDDVCETFVSVYESLEQVEGESKA